MAPVATRATAGLAAMFTSTSVYRPSDPGLRSGSIDSPVQEATVLETETGSTSTIAIFGAGPGLGLSTARLFGLYAINLGRARNLVTGAVCHCTPATSRRRSR